MSVVFSCFHELVFGCLMLMLGCWDLAMGAILQSGFSTATKPSMSHLKGNMCRKSLNLVF